MSSCDGKSIRVVLFDVGGVLVQLDGVAAVLGWLEHRITEAELWRAWLHSASVRDFESGRIDSATFAAGVLREFDIELEPKDFIESFTLWPTGLFPGALELIARIPERYVRAVLSNSNSLHWPRVMNEMGLAPAFDHHFVSHLMGKIKPDADAFQHVLDSLDCPAQQVLFLDDNQINVDAATRMGMHARVVRGVREAEGVLVQAGIIEASSAPRGDVGL